MSDGITKWLEQLGLREFDKLFAEQQVVYDDLRDLTDTDLKDLGIPLGPRKRLLRAISQLQTDRKSTDVAAQSPSSTTSETKEAERRQLTVMFCDLVGSTALSQKLDPEDMRDVNRAYQDACKEAIERYDGYVARYMGDGVLAYFGYPQAHEDDAERAIHAGLGIVDATCGLDEGLGKERGVELLVRVSITTGLAVVGDLIGEGASRESAVFGETPNVAARLQGLAAPNTVVIGPRTYALAAGRFEYADLGTHELKGIAEPVRAWRVIAPTAAESRFEALHKGVLTPLVGREHEIALLLDRWEQAKEGDGQVMLLSGEAGIGKSRIARTLRERTASEEPIRLHYQCSPYHTNSALHPIIEQLERATQFEETDSPETKLEKLESLLAQSTQDVEGVVPLFAALLSIPTEGRYARLEMSPELQKEKTLEVLVTQMHGLCRHRPVLSIFEDVHWADPTSLELLELVVEQSQGARLLVLITFRPGFAPPWTGHTHITSVTLNRFSRSLVTDMVENITGGKPLPDEVQGEIVEKTDGVPLFVEELTKTILESDLLTEESDRYELLGSMATIAVPVTLHDSLMARLDRLSTAKEVVQFASAIGREFSYDLLAAVSPLSGPKLDEALDQLVDAGLVFRRGRSPRESYIFKHALVQDAAYESLLLGKRQQLHERIAKAMEQGFTETIETQPELLAHHHTQAGATQRAVAYWHKAAQRASARSADMETVAHARRALELIEALPENRERDELKLELCIELGRALIASIGHAAPEVERTVSTALELWKKIGETPMIFPVLFARWIYQFVSGPLSESHALAEEIWRLAQSQQDPLPKLLGERTLATCLVMEGKPEAARDHTERALTLYDHERHRSMAFTFGQDGRIASLSFLVVSLWYSGYPDQARDRARVALEEARILGHANTLGQTLSFAAGLLPALCRDEARLEEGVAELVTHTNEHRLPFWEAFADATLGRLRYMQGRFDEAIEAIDRGIAGYEAQSVVRWRPTFFVWLAESHAKSEAYSEALNAIDAALDLINEYGERWFEAEVYRVKGEILRNMRPHDPVSAEALFFRAKESARSCSARSLELRATTELARVLESQYKQRYAHKLLAPLYGWFTEGFDTADLKDAKALLESLS